MISICSCEEREDEVISRNGKSKMSSSSTPELSLISDSSNLKSRASSDYPIVSFTGEKNVKVGQAYTYKVLFRNAMSQGNLNISSSNGNAILISYGDTFRKDSYKLIYNGETEINFFVLVVGAANNISLSISCDKIIDNYVVSSKLEGINATYPAIEIKAPTTVLPLEEFDVSVKHKAAPNSLFSAEWSSNFQKLGESYDKTTSTLSLKLKSYPTTSLGTHKLSLNLRGKYEPNQQFLIGQASCQIQIANPFKITQMPSLTGCNKVFEMQDLQLVSGAKITWTAGNGLKLVSGQNTGKAEFTPVEGFQGNTKVQAKIVYHNVTYNETSEEVWVGVPKIVDENQYEITWRKDGVNIIPSINGAESVTWKVVSGNITYSAVPSGAFVQTSLPSNQSGTAIIEVNATNACGISIKTYEIKIRKEPIIVPDQWNIAFPKLSGGQLMYELVYKATKDYYAYSFYITCLYTGAYDGYYASETWEWKYDALRGQYFPPEVESPYGLLTRYIDESDESHRIIVKAGTTRTCYMVQYIAPEKRLQDIEYLIFHLYDNTKSIRYSDQNDFKYDY